MPRKLTPATPATLAECHRAIRALRSARNHLRRAGAPEAAEYVSRALKSAEGALRHAWRRYYATHGYTAAASAAAGIEIRKVYGNRGKS